MCSATLTSPDGTEIAWSRAGSGPALVMVECVGASRASSPQPSLPAALAEHFTVYRYDRRGKGESGNTQPYAVAREIEDLAAVMALDDGPADVYGFSSGATLALLAAAAGAPIRRLALLEPPLSDGADSGGWARAEFERRYAQDRTAAWRWFNADIVGVPPDVMEQLPPLTEKDLQNAATIAHELTFLPSATADRFADVTAPTLLIASDHTAPVIHDVAEALAAAMPHARRSVLPGQWHGVDDATLTEAIRAFLTAPD